MKTLPRVGVSTDVPGRWVRMRVALLGGAFLLLLGGVLARAVKLQVFERDKLGGMARDQYVREVQVPARRGDIYDRRGEALARSVEADSIKVDPSLLPDVPAAARALAQALRLSRAEAVELRERMERGRRFAWVKRKARPQEVEAVRKLGLPGVGFTKEPQRLYPQRELAAHLLGTVGTDGHGLEGLERAFDQELTGEGTSLPGVRDARGRKVLVAGAANLQDHTGAHLTLTVDSHLQYSTEKALGRAVEEARGVAGMAVVMDPATGEILALANYPRFNPNVPSLGRQSHMRNRAALDLYEPGSTFKPFVVAAALEEGVVKPSSSFDCEQGAWRIGRHTINDTHPYGQLSLEAILQVSSNICTAKVAQLLGRERLQQAYRAFGFGERTGLMLPGEGRGSLPYPRAEVALATQSFGQGLSATVVQVTAAYAALANGGRLMKPYLVQKVEDPDGVVLLENRPTEVRQVVSAPVAATVLRMLESVVTSEGTAPRAALPGYRVAGKTGTAQKVDPVARGYSDKRIASFIGVVPADAPRLVIHVVVDEPKTDVYGGLVAAPAFRDIAADALAYLGVPPSQAGALAPQPAAGKGPSRAPVAAVVPAPTPPEEAEAAVSEQVGEGTVRLPDLAGQVGREAVVRLLGLELEPRLIGSGRVVGQSPAAGSVVEKGAQVTLELASR